MANGGEDLTLEMGAIDEITATLQRVNGKLAEHNKRVQQSANATKKQNRAARQSEKSMKKSGKSTGFMSSKLGGFVTRLASATAAFLALRKVVTAITQQIQKAVQVGGEFEQKIVAAGAKAEATSSQVRAIGDAAIEAGQTTVFSASEAADALGFLAQAGFSVEEQMNALPGVLELAAAGNLDLASASDIASNQVKAFRLDVSELGRVNDVLAKTSTSANTNVQQLAQGLSEVGPIAAASGQTIEETSAILGKMADAGIQGSKGGVAMRAALSKLQSPTAKTKRALADANVEIRKADGSFRRFSSILEDIENQSDNVGATMVDAFGARAGPKLMAVMGDSIDEVGEFRETLEAAGGTAEKLAAKQIDTFQGSVKILNSQIEAFRINLVRDLLPGLKGVVDAGATFFETLNNPAVIESLTDASERLGNVLEENEHAITVLSEALALLVVEGLVEAIDSTATVIDTFGSLLEVVTGTEEEASSLNDELNQTARTADAIKVGFKVMEAGTAPLTGGLNVVSDALGMFTHSANKSADSVRDLKREMQISEQVEKWKSGFKEIKNQTEEFFDVSKAQTEELLLGVIGQNKQQKKLAEKKSATVDLLSWELQALKTADPIVKRRLEFQKELLELKQKDLDAEEFALKKKILIAKKENDVSKLKQKQREEQQKKLEAQRKTADKATSILDKAQKTAKADARSQKIAQLKLDALQSQDEKVSAVLNHRRRIEEIESQGLEGAERRLAIEKSREQLQKDLKNATIKEQDKSKEIADLKIKALKTEDSLQSELLRIEAEKLNLANDGKISQEDRVRLVELEQQKRETLNKMQRRGNEETAKWIERVSSQLNQASDFSMFGELADEEFGSKLEQNASRIERLQRLQRSTSDDDRKSALKAQVRQIETENDRLRENLELRKERIRALSQTTDALGKAGGHMATLITHFDDMEKASDAARGAIGATVEGASALAGAFTDSVKEQAGWQAAIHAAAAIGSAGFAVMYPAMWSSVVSHTIAAAKYGLIASGAIGSGGSGGGGGAGAIAGGAGVGQPQLPDNRIDEERHRNAQAIAGAIRESNRQTNDLVLQMNMSGAIITGESEQGAREIGELVRPEIEDAVRELSS